MAWIILLVSGLLESVWAIGMKYSEGFSKPVPSAITIVAMIISVILLSFSVKELPIGTAYAVWTGIGAVGTVILGIVLLGEPCEFLRIACITVIIAGIAGLKITSGH